MLKPAAPVKLPKILEHSSKQGKPPLSNPGAAGYPAGPHGAGGPQAAIGAALGA
jgi:hypothetical protein